MNLLTFLPPPRHPDPLTSGWVIPMGTLGSSSGSGSGSSPLVQPPSFLPFGRASKLSACLATRGCSSSAVSIHTAAPDVSILFLLSVSKEGETQQERTQRKPGPGVRPPPPSNTARHSHCSSPVLHDKEASYRVLLGSTVTRLQVYTCL